MENVELSIVSPCFNEGECINMFILSVHKVISCLDPSFNFELIIVDDGSTDDSWEKIQDAEKSLSGGNISIRGLRLISNFGQMAALEAGLQESTGKYVLTMDSDMQHPSELIRDFFQKRKHSPVIFGVQTKRDEKFWKGFFSKLFYGFLERISGMPLVSNGGDFRLIDRRVLDYLSAINANSIIIRFTVQRMRIPYSTIPFEAGSRVAGSSKYNFSKMWNLAINSIVAVTSRPLRFSIFFSFVFGGFLVLQIVYISCAYFAGAVVPGWTSLAVLLNLGLITITIILSIQSLYIEQIYSIIQNFPRFIPDFQIRQKDAR